MPVTVVSTRNGNVTVPKIVQTGPTKWTAICSILVTIETTSSVRTVRRALVDVLVVTARKIVLMAVTRKDAVSTSFSCCLFVQVKSVCVCGMRSFESFFSIGIQYRLD